MKNKLLHILIFPILISFPNANFAQAPDLGAVSGFALFTTTGAFDNVGASTHVTGDVGTNGGAFNAFPDGTLVGQKHVVDGTSAQAAADLSLAYAYLSGLTCGVGVIGTTLGNGQILTPDVYCQGAASTLNGDLTLDGQGDPNALFIIKIGGAFSTSAYSNVILINSASLCNVYWQIDGAFNLGNGSVFSGTLIAAGPISLNTGATLNGRSLTTAGAITTDAMTAAIPCSAAPLPIKLLDFKASNKQSSNLLTWSTATEINNNYFTLERTADRVVFTEVARITGAGNSNTLIHYSANDFNPYEGTTYYRLKQTDFDGNFTYSNLVSVDFVIQQAEFYKISPNPFLTSINITIGDMPPINNYEFRMFNILGEVVISQTITNQFTTLETGNLPSEVYFYKLILSEVDGLSGNNKTIQSGRLISKR